MKPERWMEDKNARGRGGNADDLELKVLWSAVCVIPPGCYDYDAALGHIQGNRHFRRDYEKRGKQSAMVIFLTLEPDISALHYVLKTDQKSQDEGRRSADEMIMDLHFDRISHEPAAETSQSLAEACRQTAARSLLYVYNL
ncbi:hypothetical protein DPX16_12560 [Anabarilius grahami]|uniref:Uncharacterized protein n=1 Tax=Anabarilius grahami TaxID=495550 RepID=A0A3N0YKI1_ANAGA|nr:hypothetical protein DPX16_12560 [Anabarilius grahami]